MDLWPARGWGYVPPLKVTFTSITGQDIDTDPITGICPPLTAAQASLVEELRAGTVFEAWEAWGNSMTNRI